jgi:uncharacterized protein
MILPDGEPSRMVREVHVLELWRYPVKSLQGERLDAAEITPEGVDGDRRFALFDVDTGFGLTARRVPELLFASAHLRDDGGVDVVLPDGSTAGGDDALSTWIGRPVTLRSASTAGARRYENPVDFERETTSVWSPFDGAGGAFHDSGRVRVSLVSTATIGSWDRRRFRANVLLDGDGEDGLVGSQVSLGDAVLDVGMHIERCVMTTRPQPDGIERDLDVLRTIQRERDGCLAVGALVVRPGTVRVGASLTPVPS